MIYQCILIESKLRYAKLTENRMIQLLTPCPNPRSRWYAGGDPSKYTGGKTS